MAGAVRPRAFLPDLVRRHPVPLCDVRAAALSLPQPVDQGAALVGGGLFPARFRALLRPVERTGGGSERPGARHAGCAHADHRRDVPGFAALCTARRAATPPLCPPPPLSSPPP